MYSLSPLATRVLGHNRFATSVSFDRMDVLKHDALCAGGWGAEDEDRSFHIFDARTGLPRESVAHLLDYSISDDCIFVASEPHRVAGAPHPGYTVSLLSQSNWRAQSADVVLVELSLAAPENSFSSCAFLHLLPRKNRCLYRFSPDLGQVTKSRHKARSDTLSGDVFDEQRQLLSGLRSGAVTLWDSRSDSAPTVLFDTERAAPITFCRVVFERYALVHHPGCVRRICARSARRPAQGGLIARHRSKTLHSTSLIDLRYPALKSVVDFDVTAKLNTAAPSIYEGRVALSSAGDGVVSIFDVVYGTLLRNIEPFFKVKSYRPTALASDCIYAQDFSKGELIRREW
jgi:hypothetical protein